jgi:hypothetical protein
LFIWLVGLLERGWSIEGVTLSNPNLFFNKRTMHKKARERESNCNLANKLAKLARLAKPKQAKQANRKNYSTTKTCPSAPS